MALMGSTDIRLMTHIPGPESDQHYRADLSEVGQEVDFFQHKIMKLGYRYRYSPASGEFNLAQTNFLYPVFNAT